MAAHFENEIVEFKRSIENFKDISKTSCAFANTSGGKIYVGMSNEGKALGIATKEADSMQQRIEGAIQLVSPVPLHKISAIEIDGKTVLLVEIFQLGQGTFCTFGGILYYRSGSSNIKLEGRTLQDYLVKRHVMFFDELLTKATIKDLDEIRIEEFLHKRSPSIPFEENKLQEYLTNLNLGQANGEFHLKNAGVLFFAKSPSKFIPQSEIKLVRFKGKTPIDIIDSRYINSNIIQNLNDAEAFIRKNTSVSLKIEQLERKEITEYPITVIREALVNAVAHRDYFSRDSIQINIFDDRLEFINPGTLPNGLSLKILGTLSIQRNPLLYRLMRDVGFIEGLATGIPRIRAELRKYGLPEPNFEELGNFFRVTIYNKHYSDASGLSQRQKRALSYLEKNPSISSRKYSEINNKISLPIAVSDLNSLCEKGILRKIGKTKGSYYTLPKNVI